MQHSVTLKHSSKLRKDYEEQRGVFICGRKNCGICNILEPVNKFKSTTTGKVRKLIFVFIVTMNVQCNYWHVRFVENSMLDQP